MGVKGSRSELPGPLMFLCHVQVKQELCHRVHFILQLTQLRFVVALDQRAKEFLELLDIFHRRSVASSGQSRKAREVVFGTSLSGAVHNHKTMARGADSLVFHLVAHAARIIGMTWLSILIQTIIDWLREIPVDLLGRRVDDLLDKTLARRRRKRTRSHPRRNLRRHAKRSKH